MKPLPRLLAALLARSAATGTRAEGEGTPALPLWELGAFAVGVSQQAHPSSDQQVRQTTGGSVGRGIAHTWKRSTETARD